MPRCKLYLITPNGLELPNALETFSLQMREAFNGGEVACFQLRMKNASDDDIRRATKLLMPIAHEFNCAFVLNDRADLAAELQTDGVHIGQSDAPYGEARKLVGDKRIVGVTAHASRHLAIEAADAGADYVAFGAFFPTQTKEPAATANVEILEWWTEIMEVPCVAIGGIMPENAEPLIQAGADFLAVSSGVWNYGKGPACAVAAFNALFAA